MLDDLTITRLCAEAMGFGFSGWVAEQWRPLVDKAQAMELVEKLKLSVVWTERQFDGWLVRGWYTGAKTKMVLSEEVDNSDLLRAICLCVAKMQLAKEKRDAAA